MAIQMADSDLLDRRMVHLAVDRSPVIQIDDSLRDDDRTTAARGVMTAVFISTPFWALLGFTFYLLL